MIKVLKRKFLLPSTILKSAFLYQDYFPLGELRAIKGEVTLYVSAGYKLRFSL